jgi:hypothetical protein
MLKVRTAAQAGTREDLEVLDDGWCKECMRELVSINPKP